MNKNFTVLGLLVMISFGCTKENSQQKLTSDSQKSVRLANEASINKESFLEFDHEKLIISSQDVEEIKSLIIKNPTYKSYHLFLLPNHLNIKMDLSKSTIASILSSAILELTCLNDFGHLEYDSKVAKLLIDTGDEALVYLSPMLNNKDRAHLFGSASATLSSIFKYRRCDFAYRYICLIIGEKPIIHQKPSDRDIEIKKLKEKLKKLKNLNEKKK